MVIGCQNCSIVFLIYFFEKSQFLDYVRIFGSNCCLVDLVGLKKEFMKLGEKSVIEGMEKN